MAHDIEDVDQSGRGGPVGALIARVRAFATREDRPRPVWSQDRSDAFLRELDARREADGGEARGLDGVAAAA